MTVIEISALVSLSSLSGWCAGLIWQVRRHAGWHDEGARLAWAVGVGGLTVISAAAGLTIAFAGGPGWILLATIAAGASALCAHWACDHLAAPDEGERRDRHRGVQWHLAPLRRLPATARCTLAARARSVRNSARRRPSRRKPEQVPVATNTSPARRRRPGA